MQQVGRMPPAGKPLGSVQRQGIPHLLPLVHGLQRKAAKASLSAAGSRSGRARQTPNLCPTSMMLSILWRCFEVMALVCGGIVGHEPFRFILVVVCR